MNVSLLRASDLAARHLVGLAFLYVPLLVVAILSFNTVKSLSWPPQGFTTALVGGGMERRRAAGRVVELRQGGARRHVDRARAGHARRVRAPALPVLRKELALVRDPAADRTARHRHRDRVAQRDRSHHRFRSVRVPHRVRLPVAGHRPRHVLRRDRLQQRRRPFAPIVGEPARGLGRSRRPRPADVPVRDVPADAFGARVGRDPRLCPELRRDRRHHVHRRIRLHHAAAVDLCQHQPPQQRAAGQRDGDVRDGGVDPVGVSRAASRRPPRPGTAG